MKYSANNGVGFSAPLVCKQTKCLSTTTVCGIQNDVKYHGVGNVANEANIGSGTGCKAFCRGAHQDAKYFTYSPNKSCCVWFDCCDKATSLHQNVEGEFLKSLIFSTVRGVLLSETDKNQSPIFIRINAGAAVAAIVADLSWYLSWSEWIRSKRMMISDVVSHVSHPVK